MVFHGSLLLYGMLSMVGLAESKDVRWKWVAGSSAVNKAGVDFHTGARTGGLVFKDYYTYYDFYVFGGLKHDPTKNTDILVNDLWHVSGSSSAKLLHPGSTDESFTQKAATYPPPRMLGAGCGIPGAMFMVYGGYGKNDEVLGDTWIFDLSSKIWLTLKDMYPTKDTNNTALLSPPARADMAVWCLKEKLIIFGGVGNDNNPLADMWEFSLKEMKWKEMRSSINHRKFYMNYLAIYPQASNGATTWAKQDVLYLFGGNEANNYNWRRHTNAKFSSDMYMYVIEEDTWSHVKGTASGCHPGHYAFLGQHAEDNNPGCRRGGSGMVDTEGNLWLFGGEGADTNANSISSVKPPKNLADLWHFNVKEKHWAYKGGLEKAGSVGIYKDKNVYYSGSMPGSRYDSMAVVAGNTMFIYGGTGLDSTGKEGLLSDLWEIDMHNYVAYFSAVYPPTVFNLVFWPLLVVAVICISFMYVRKFYSRLERKASIEYSLVSQENDH